MLNIMPVIDPAGPLFVFVPVRLGRDPKQGYLTQRETLTIERGLWASRERDAERSFRFSPSTTPTASCHPLRVTSHKAYPELTTTQLPNLHQAVSP